MITEIKNESVKISVNSFGAELYSIEAPDGTSYLWDGKPEFWKGRAPILFPFVGALRGGTAHSKMGDIVLPRHGLARSAEWTLESQTKDSLTYLLNSTSESKKNYPYDFSLRVRYKIENSIVTTEFHVRNTSGCDMPYCVGGHPAFHIPLVKGEEFTDYIVEFEKPETADCPNVDMEAGLILNNRYHFLKNERAFRLNHDLFRKDALVFDDLKSRSVKLFSEKSGHGVQMSFEGMNYFAVWSPVNDSPFVCLEPWTGTATLESEDDIFEHKRGIHMLKPGEEDTVSFTVKIF